jgi:hypothetical protein
MCDQRRIEGDIVGIAGRPYLARPAMDEIESGYAGLDVPGKTPNVG